MSAFKGWQSLRKNQLFAKFPNITLAPTNYVYGFPGCVLWLDAAVNVTGSNDGDPVSLWLDRIINQSFINNTGSTQPVFVSSNALFNNLPTVHFNGSTKFMRGYFPIKNKEFTVIAVANITTGLTFQTLIGSTSGAGILTIGGASGTLNGAAIRNAAGTTILDGTSKSAAPRIYGLTNASIIVNEAIEKVQTPIFINWDAERLGRRASATDSALNGNLAELIIYDHMISAPNVARIQNILNQKYLLY